MDRVRPRLGGMTLIELLVVVLIISILSGIAVPVFVGHIDKANMTATQSLLDNLAVSLNQYYTDNKSYPPSGADSLRRYMMGLPPAAAGKMYMDIPTENIALKGWEHKVGSRMGHFTGTSLLALTSSALVDVVKLPSGYTAAAVDMETQPIVDAWQRPIIYIRQPILEARHMGAAPSGSNPSLLDEYQRFKDYVARSDQRTVPKGMSNSSANLRNMPYHLSSFQLYSFGLDGYTVSKPPGDTDFSVGGPGSLLWNNNRDDDADGYTDFAKDNTGKRPDAKKKAEDDIMSR